jgi:branched-chain amino acid transport system ATP-binding protein
MGLERHIDTRDHLAALLDLPAIQRSERQVAGRVAELIELMNLQSYRDKFVSELSTGVRRIVDLTMAIAHNPSVLLLDEPSSGVAQRETEALGPLLKDMQRATQCSIVIIEHDMPLISFVSDEIIALDLGRVVTRGSPSAVLSDARVVASYLGDDAGVIQRSGSVSSPPAQAPAPMVGNGAAVDPVLPRR